jgi:aminoglycoside phosphotransferase (APT) family kinase protein
MNGLIDQTAAVRPGEELDLAKVRQYLRQALPDLQGELEVEQFPSGHSNLTYLLKVGNREMVLRRPPFGSKVKTAHDMNREFRIFTALHPIYPLVPRPLAFCEDESVLGAKFYLMERIQGVILRKEMPAGVEFSAQIATALCESFIKNLATIHGLDYKKAGLDQMGKPEGYLSRQVAGWAERYVGSQTDDIPQMHRIIAWLKEKLPVSPPATMVHNDYKYDNLILDPNDLTRIIGVLDWEMATIGDPLADLGVALGYWVEKDDPTELKATAFGPTAAEGSYNRRRLAERYAELTGRDITHLHYYVVFALFKIAVIIQQIYFRFAQGLTKDARFGPMIEAVKLISRAAVEMIERGKI